MSFTPQQREMLSADLDAKCVRRRKQSGFTLSYIEGWHAIAEANRIFGFDGWQRETVDIRCVSEKPRKVGKGQYERDGHGVTYVARVRVCVDGLVREGCGAGHGIAVDLGDAHESAIKEAETDAMKRALTTFGNPFGLALYDKEQKHVSSGSDRADHSCGVATPRSTVKSTGNGADKPVDTAQDFKALQNVLRGCQTSGNIDTMLELNSQLLDLVKKANPDAYDAFMVKVGQRKDALNPLAGG
jgi:DNA recombination protein Rad52